MTTITEDYVSFEIAKLLKEKGFEGYSILTIYDENASNSYIKELRENHLPYSSDDPKFKEFYYTKPTLQMAMKWLREVHGLHISLEPCYDHVSMHVVFLAFVQNVADVHEFFDGRKNIASHPSAETSYELAIKYCLENLI